MPSLAGGRADLAGHQPQPRLDRVEQRRLPDAALAGKDRLAVGQQLSQPGNPRPGLGTGQHHLVAKPGIESRPADQFGRIEQIDLVDTQNRRDLPLFGADQKPVDQDGLEVVGGDDDHELIDVGDDQVGTVPAAAREHAVPGFDPLDHARLQDNITNQHAVAGDHGVALVPGQ